MTAMQLIDPEILREARGLSVGLCALGTLIGLALWLTGWTYHRFWVVLGATVSAGCFGLFSSPVYRVQPLVVGLLLAVAAGVLALALIRVLAFVAGGIALWLVIHSVAPASWHEPLVCLLVGGLAGLFLFRVWMKILTSFFGTLILTYSGLCLLDRLGKLDMIALSEQKGPMFNWACAALTLIGLGAQIVIDHRVKDRKRKKEEWAQQQAEEKLRQFYAKQANAKKSWLSLFRSKPRKAG
jgi:hypothetical protein